MTASCACTREGAKKTRSPERALSPIQLAGATPPDAPLTEACRAASQEKPGIYSRFPRVILPARGLIESTPMKINTEWLGIIAWAVVAITLVSIYALAFAVALPSKALYLAARPLQGLLDRLSGSRAAQ